jgi:hypothetical protein
VIGFIPDPIELSPSEDEPIDDITNPYLLLGTPSKINSNEKNMILPPYIRRI